MMEEVSSHAPPGLPMPLKPLPPEEIDPPHDPEPYVPAPEEADDFEYDVEEVDPEVTAHAAAQAKAELRRAEAAIDVDQVFRELNPSDPLDGALGELRARFSIKTLLGVTTAVAIFFGVWASGLLSSGSAIAVLICLALLGLGVAHAWLNYVERRRRDEVIAKRRRQLREARRLSHHPDADEFEDEEDDEPAPTTAKGIPFVLLGGEGRIGLGEMLLAVTISSAIVGLLGSVSPVQGAAALGAVAICGFALQAAEIEPPRPVMLAFWFSLVGYCFLTLVSIGAG